MEQNSSKGKQQRRKVNEVRQHVRCTTCLAEGHQQAGEYWIGRAPYLACRDHSTRTLEQLAEDVRRAHGAR